jgi:hypothetical protein
VGQLTVRYSAVVGLFKVAVRGEGVRNARLLRFCEFLVDRIVEALPHVSFEPVCSRLRSVPGPSASN